MKNVAFFITHKTLDFEHADLSFKSMSQQKGEGSFDVLYIYNSHEDELPNDTILQLIETYSLGLRFNEIKIFPYDTSTPKTLGGDIFSIKTFCDQVYNPKDRILLMKSDIILSVNYFDDILNKLPEDREIYYAAPYINAKARISNDQIIQYSLRERYIASDDITFFVEDEFQSPNNDFNNRDGVDITDEEILFFSCYVIRDFTCHYLTLSLLNKVRIRSQSWGGVWFESLAPYLVKTDRSFVIHKYHDVVSTNRVNTREGPVEDWFLS